MDFMLLSLVFNGLGYLRSAVSLVHYLAISNDTGLQGEIADLLLNIP